MQFTTLSVAFFAALASAHNLQHVHYRRNFNTSSIATSIDSGESTTLTVYSTQIHTITSCAASITDCPARASESTSEMVVTDVITLATTICPVTATESATSAIHSSYSASLASSTSANGGVESTPAVGPLSTGVTPYPTAGASGPASSSETVLTYTLGTGTSTTVVTTTIKHTSTATVYATVPAETSGSEGTVTGKQGDATSSVESTTTITGTSTSTRYITVSAAPTATSGSSGSDNTGSDNSGASPSGNGGSSGQTGSCAPVTVTVTTALSTVTVTETAAAVPTPADSGSFTTIGGSEGVVTSSYQGPVIYSTATIVPIPMSTYTPAPYQNGTSTKTKCSSVYPSSGFISKTKLPTTTSEYPIYGTGYPTY